MTRKKLCLVVLFAFCLKLFAFEYSNVEIIGSLYKNGLNWFPNASLYDLDQDGLSDILVGVNMNNIEGRIRVFNNIGSDSLPKFKKGNWLTDHAGKIIKTTCSG